MSRWLFLYTNKSSILTMPFAPNRRRVVRFKVEHKHTEVYNANGRLKLRIARTGKGEYVDRVRAEIGKYPPNVWDVEVYGEFAPMILDDPPSRDEDPLTEEDYVLVEESSSS